MPTPFSGFISSDGKPFLNEIECVKHELRLALRDKFSASKHTLGEIEAHLDWFLGITAEYHRLASVTPIEVSMTPIEVSNPVLKLRAFV